MQNRHDATEDAPTEFTIGHWRTLGELQEISARLETTVVEIRKETKAIRDETKANLESLKLRVDAHDTQSSKWIGIGVGISICGAILWALAQAAMWAANFFSKKSG